MMTKNTTTKKIVAVWDCETDPFQYRVKPEVFLTGIYDGKILRQWWGATAMRDFCEYLREAPPMYLFAHNGGKFDFFYLPWPLGNPVRIINGRIASAKFGRHELRDSYCLLPFPLSAYRKDEINYDTFTAQKREANKAEITAYHATDIHALYELVSQFIDRFGLRLTAPSTAIRELSKLHAVERKTESHDAKFRRYLHGGRVECFETGIIHGNFKCYDVNSMYPSVMRNVAHPTSKEYEWVTDEKKILTSRKPGFVTVDATSQGALPLKDAIGRLTFPHGRFTFDATTHELRAANALGLVKIHDIHAGYLAQKSTKFAAFVDVFVTEKIAAQKAKDKISELFAKLILNSAYGKFAANPEKYYDWRFILETDPWPSGWDLFEDWGWVLVLRKPATLRAFSYFDVATGASITGAARAVLLRAIKQAVRPIYCDTDSIICEHLSGKSDNHKLGAWKLEARADRAIIIGKKLYALTLTEVGDSIIKSANKGVQMALKDFIEVANGGEYTYFRDAPTFQKDGSVTFINRRITK